MLRSGQLRLRQASEYSRTSIPKQTLLHNRNLTVLSPTLILHMICND
jgi:hypothetical protein